MGPDEHVEHAHNSIYTNLVANLAVSTARWTSCLTNGLEDSVSTVPDEWLDKMADLVFTFNAERRYHEEYEGFNQQLETGKRSTL
jgi:trehalose/maltose hydrolase-like predicted phosphorylase